MRALVLLIITCAVAVAAAMLLPPPMANEPGKLPLAQTQPLENIELATMQLDSVVLGAGCFWGAEKRYAAIPGVVDAVSGYADGRGVEPSYRAITQLVNKNNPDNWAEVVQVTYNPRQVSLRTLLQHYFEGHDPTQVNRQGADIGTQYRSTILTHTDEQTRLAQQVRDEYQQRLSAAGFGQIATLIKPLQQFVPAEDYHQDYLVKNPNGYCPDHATGVRFATAAELPKPKVDNQPLLSGKHIVIIEAEDCPFCELLKQDVLNAYQGSVPLHYRKADQLAGLTVTTPTWATPTILFIEQGVEVAGHQGYLAADPFYRALGGFKLGDSEAYRVAFAQGTDARFCRQYEQFKHTPDGVFIDALSGAALFDTKDRFNSGSGWLSFTKPVAGAVTEHQDLSYGMVRTEVRSASSGIHLGHVFDDGPNDQPRYCINATVLEFRAR